MFGELLHYDKLYDAMLDLNHQDLLLVVGTSLSVCPLDRFIKTIDCTKVFINKDEIRHINMNAFTHAYYGECMDVLPKLLKHVKI